MPASYDVCHGEVCASYDFAVFGSIANQQKWRVLRYICHLQLWTRNAMNGGWGGLLGNCQQRLAELLIHLHRKWWPVGIAR